jgi:hypothetical protein
MRRFSVIAPAFLLCIPAATAQNQPWLPKPDCKVTPWLDGCPDADKFKNIDLSKFTGPTITPVAGPRQASAPQRLVQTAPAAATQVDWRRPISPKPLAADWPRWKFAPADASLVLGIKVKALFESLLFKDLFAGVAPTTVEEVWISLRTASNGRPDAAMLLLGPALEPVATELRSKGVTVCFVDERSLLAGEWNAVDRALQRVLNPTAANPMDRRVRELWDNYDVSIVVDQSLASSFLAAGGQAALPASVSRVSMGMSIRDKLAFDLLLHTAKAADASLLAARYGKETSALGLPEGAGAQEVHNVVPGGLSVRVTLDATQMPEPLRRQLSAQFGPVVDMVRAKTEKPAAKGVVIQGLDDGPRVVP